MEHPDRIDVNDPKYDDPVVAEVRRLREEFSARFGHDIHAMAEYLRARERERPPGTVLALGKVGQGRRRRAAG
jgi:N-formylglutamate amidohydrolase